MPKDKSDIECRYCKEVGHYKNECPKLKNKPPRTNAPSRPRLLGANHQKQNVSNPRKQNVSSRQTYQNRPKTPPSFMDLFPEPEWKSPNPKQANSWGDKSFKDVTEVIEEEQGEGEEYIEEDSGILKMVML